jgi:ribosome biogenesis GTPase
LTRTLSSTTGYGLPVRSQEIALHDFTSLHNLGWRSDDQPEIPPTMRPARVVHQGKGAWQVHDGSDEFTAIARSRTLAPIPVTGDWVLIDDASGTCVIETVLPRRTTLSRAEAGGRSEEQVIATNIDLVGICTPADAVNARRLERELTAVWSSGASPLAIVTKADLVEDPWTIADEVRSVCVGADVALVSSMTGDGLDDVRERVAPGTTVALIGPSGVGKSSLVNALCGREVLPTNDVRRDGKGRHTTTSRHLVPLPGGGLLLDTPGMREFAPWADDNGLSGTFADIEELASSCRFADCQHDSEPGCQVVISAAQDPMVAQRLASWRALQRELAWLERRHDARLMAQERRKWASIKKSARGVIRP